MHVPYHIYTNESQEYVDSHVVHTSQLFFGDALYEQISLQDPYCHSETYRVRNVDDHVYQADPTAVLNIAQSNTLLTEGLIGTITAVVDPAATPSLAQSQMVPHNFDQDLDSEGSAGGSPAVTIVSPAPPDAMPAGTAESNTAAVSHHRSVLCCRIILWCTALALHAQHDTEKLHACKACLLLDSMQAI